MLKRASFRNPTKTNLSSDTNVDNEDEQQAVELSVKQQKQLHSLSITERAGMLSLKEVTEIRTLFTKVYKLRASLNQQLNQYIESLQDIQTLVDFIEEDKQEFPVNVSGPKQYADFVEESRNL